MWTNTVTYSQNDRQWASLANQTTTTPVAKQKQQQQQPTNQTGNNTGNPLAKIPVPVS